MSGERDGERTVSSMKALGKKRHLLPAQVFVASGRGSEQQWDMEAIKLRSQ